MQLTLSSFTIIRGYPVTTLLVSCVSVDGSVSWYSGQLAHKPWTEKMGFALWPPPHSRFLNPILSVLSPWSHFQEDLAEQQHTDGPPTCSQPSQIYQV